MRGNTTNKAKSYFGQAAISANGGEFNFQSHKAAKIAGISPAITIFLNGAARTSNLWAGVQAISDLHLISAPRWAGHLLPMELLLPEQRILILADLKAVG